MEAILKTIPKEEVKLPADPEEALKILQGLGKPEFLPGELEAWKLTEFIEGLVPFMEFYPDKVWEEFHPSIVQLVLFTAAAFQTMKGGIL